MATIKLTGRALTAGTLKQICDGAPVILDTLALARMADTRRVIEDAVAQGKPVYGVTTGLGPKVVHALPAEELDAFAMRAVRGRAHAAGDDFDENLCRAILAVRLNTLLIGAAGVRPALAELMAACLIAGLAPAIRETGSIGPADLMQGGDFGLAMIGEGRMWANGKIVASAEALAGAGLEAWVPGPREGLALVSHSSISAALGAVALQRVENALAAAQSSAALSMEGFRANLSVLDEDLLALRPQPGQSEAASGLRGYLEGTKLFEPGEARRLQDPLSFRNLPQVHGAVFAALEQLRIAVDAEINGASDNPGVLPERGEVASHGGYLTTHLAITLGAVAQALTYMAAAQVARIGKLWTGRYSDLPVGLTNIGIVGAGFGPVFKTAESLFAEIVHDAAPAPVYPGFSADGLEDVVSYTVIAGKSVLRIADRLADLTAIELLAGSQAVEMRGIKDEIGKPMRTLWDKVRGISPVLEDDRPLGDEIHQLARLVREGEI